MGCMQHNLYFIVKNELLHTPYLVVSLFSKKQPLFHILYSGIIRLLIILTK
jgi:hypothetical protein